MEVLYLIDLSKVDNSPITNMALILGVSAFGVLICMLILGKLLQMLKLPNKIIQPIISFVGVIAFLYVVVYLGDIIF